MIDSAFISPVMQYGLAGVVIIALVTTVTILYKQVKQLQSEKDNMYERQLEDAKETRNKLSESMEEQARLSKQIYDLLISINSKRGI